MSRVAITVFRLHDSIGGTPMSSLAAVKEDIRYDEYDAPEGSPLAPASIVVKTEDEKAAKWREWVAESFDVPELSVSLPGAALILQVPLGAASSGWFAVCLGSGHHLIEQNAIVRHWGLRTALNILHRTTGAAEELKRVDSKNVAESRMFTAKQTSRANSIDRFGLDTYRDLLSAVAGEPEAPDVWGGIITGKDGIHVAIDRPISEMVAVCAALQAKHDEQHYQTSFGWVDHISLVRDQTLRSALMNQMVHDFQTRQTASYELAPPELTSWDRTFRYVGVGRRETNRLSITEYLTLLSQSPTQNGASNKLTDLDEAMLRSHKVEIWNGNSLEDSWSVLRCIDGELSHNGQTYVVFNGDFFEVAANFIAEVDSYLSTIQSDRGWPPKQVGRDEAGYIDDVDGTSMQSIVMDRKTIKVRTMTSPVEVCDLYQAGRRIVHLKRKTSSSTLSHLMNQAVVSSQLLVRDADFRQKAYDALLQQESAKKQAHGTSFSRFAASEFNHARFVASNFTIVVGVLTNWDAAVPWQQQLPFFSRLTLRNLHEALRTIGYLVVFAAIDSPDD